MRKIHVILISVVFALIGLEFIYLAWHFKLPWPLLELMLIGAVYAAIFYSLHNPNARSVRRVRCMVRRKVWRTRRAAIAASAPPRRPSAVLQSQVQ
jgi:hypothetical protein